MDRESADIIASFDDRLKQLDRALSRTSPTRPQRAWTAGRVLGGAVVVLGAAIVPFVALVRLGSWFYVRWHYPTWLALVVAVAITVVFVTATTAWWSRRLTGRARPVILAKWVAIPMVVAYCGYALLYVADVNTKTPEVRAYYQTLHPMLRVALSTLILADDDLVITDAARTPEDYARMGLPERERSDHFTQRDGYVHAVDVRTIGRSGLRNRAVESYFHLMGFRTLRHVGTADHLHVGLAVR